jgi:hypothetical protein
MTPNSQHSNGAPSTRRGLRRRSAMAMLVVCGLILVSASPTISADDRFEEDEAAPFMELPPGHPPIDCELPPGHPPIGEVEELPPGHPPLDAIPDRPADGALFEAIPDAAASFGQRATTTL